MKKHIHISLVGGQPVPAYLGITYTKPDKIILICSVQSAEEAHRIASYSLDIPTEIRQIAPVDIKQIETDVATLRQQVADDQVSINLTGGTKPWSLLFYIGFKTHSDIHFYYISQNNQITDLETKECHLLKMDRQIQFQLYGNPLIHFKRFTEYTNEDKTVCQEIEQARRYNFKSFKELTTVLKPNDAHKVRNSKQGEIILPDGEGVRWDKTEQTVWLSLYHTYKGWRDFTWTSPHVISLVFFSGWFEFTIANALNQNPKVQQLWMNCEFTASNNAPKNETDIIADMGSKLLFVACKTQIREIREIDKFRSALKNYGGMGSKGLFVTYAPLPDIALEKCKDNGISSFHFDSQKSFTANSKALNQLVDKILLSTNIR